ncbi:hypothetical protein BCR35DRAFT_79383 [Leucosporidium creatinivorum]|uniref:Uncharacterized protein n=1 Tax=Leucosporidium creatinivorum TaxID=106004 RepID=A0A1Y2FGA6_9BASI|nr:hypothetical protein BCR35DRAFT_79383 [Leucosporidium creatinivorum]
MASPSPLLSPLHRIPVLWSLYRPLLRLSSNFPVQRQQRTTESERKGRASTGNALQAHVRRLFRRGRKLGNLQQVKKRLTEAHTLLDDLQRAQDGSAHHHQQITLLSAHLARYTPISSPPPPAVPPKPRRSPSILFSTPYHPPLPRLKPQPEHISMMIFNRRRAIQRRWDRVEETKAWAEDGKREAEFDRRLGFEAGAKGEWGLEWKEMANELGRKAGKEARLSQMRISPEMQEKANIVNRQQAGWARRKGEKRSRASAGPHDA